MAQFSIGNFNFSFGAKPKSARSMSNLISRFQFSRYKQDIASWRAALVEMELAYYPHRVQVQRIFIDTVINPHVHACLTRAHDLVLLKDFGFYSGQEIDEKTTELFRDEWFTNLMKYTLEAEPFGYSLIELGDMVGDRFPFLRLIPRENVSPDREVMSSLVYQISGEQFTDPSNPYYNWNVWVKTPSDKGTSPCGYGLLYKIANLEIFLRNLLGANANYNDKYGQPIRWGKTSKTAGPEYEQFKAFLRDLGEDAWIITDPNDEIEFPAPAAEGKGGGFKTYENFEMRLEKKISKVLLGHADALDSTPGKLGGTDGEKSPAALALDDLETKKCKFVENMVNDQLIPKLMNIGFKMPNGLVFKFKNDKEEEDIRNRQDISLQATATAVKTFSDAGYEVEEKWLNDHTGIKITKKEVPEPLANPVDPKLQEKLKNLYKF